MEKIYESGVETAKKIRKVLKSAFPHIKFSVRSDYNSVNIHWTDGATRDEVETITNRFQSGHFDGMQDMYISGDGYEWEGKLYSGAKYIFCNRHLSDEYREQVETFGVSYGYDMNRNQWNYYHYFNEAEKKMIAAKQPSIIEPSTTNESTQQTTIEITSNDITITLNEEKKGIEISFTEKPSEELREQLKANGFKYYHHLNKKWIAKQTQERIAYAYSLIPSETVEEPHEEHIAPVDVQPVTIDTTFDIIDTVADISTSFLSNNNINHFLDMTSEQKTEYKVYMIEQLEAHNITIDNILLSELTANGYNCISEVLEPEQPQQIEVKSITFLWSESSIIEDNTMANSFKEATNIIHSIARDMGTESGYRKTAFIIEWNDGRTHEGRIDIEYKLLNKSNPLGDHVKYFYENLAGIRKPSHYTWEQHKNHLQSVHKMTESDMEEMKQILNTYLLDDIQPEQITTIEPEPITEQPTKSNVIQFVPRNKSTEQPTKQPISNNNTPISLSDIRANKQREREENEQMEKALSYVIENIIPFLEPEEFKHMMTLQSEPDKFLKYMYEVDLKIKLRNKIK